MQLLKHILQSIILVGITAISASYFTNIGLDSWYHLVAHPTFTPPDKVFPIAWSIIYILLIIVYSIILHYPQKPSYSSAKRIFIEQLLLQIVWCFLFFQQKYLGLGLGVIILLDYTVFQLIKTTRLLNPLAAYLLIPYFLWLCF